MGLLSFFQREKQLKCDWCGKEMQQAAHTKHIRNRKFSFCSQSCKQSFRRSGKGKTFLKSCPSCPLSPR